MNIDEILKMIGDPKALQERAEEMRQRMARMVFSGSSGGGMVVVTLNGQMDMIGIQIAPESIDPLDIAMLGDLIRAAHADAMSKVRQTLQVEMSSGLGSVLPGFRP